MKSEVRFGRVSNIDYPAGTCEVTYKDRDETVTKQVSFISNRQYIMPKVGDLLIALHPGTQSEDAVVLGTIWNNVNTPAEGYEGLYRKDYDLEQGKCYRRYDANVPEALYHIEGDDYVEVKKNQQTDIDGDANITIKGKLVLKVGSCTVTIEDGTVTVDAASKLNMTAPNIKIDGNTVNITGEAGDCVIRGVSLVNHVHTGNLGTPTSPPL